MCADDLPNDLLDELPDDPAQATPHAPQPPWLRAYPPGVYRLAGHRRPGPLLATVASWGWRAAYIDGKMVVDKQTFLAATGQALAFPDYAGHNWDALEELLRDLSWLPAPGYLLLYDHVHRFARAAPDQWQIALEIFRHAARTWEAEHVPFYLLLRQVWWTNRQVPRLAEVQSEGFV
jgi:RNAse (barnase) inhibitor barstar